MSNYEDGLDVLGVSFGDFVPWLNVISKATGGIAELGEKDKGKDKGTTEEIVKKALAEQKKQQEAKEAAAKAEAQARKTQTLLYVTLGVVGLLGVGGLVLFLKKK